MIILINGSFGVGKTTTARRLRKRLGESVIYNPEWAGSVLMRLPKRIGLDGSTTDDFQDMKAWRRATILGIRIFRAFRPVVIVPMTFDRADYFTEILAGISAFDNRVKTFCLTAPLAVIEDRLRGRGQDLARADCWVARRISECAKAFNSHDFGEPIDTSIISPDEAARIVELRISALESV